MKKLMTLVFTFGLISVNAVAQVATKDWIVLFKAPELEKNLAKDRSVNRIQMEKSLRQSNQVAVARLSARMASVRNAHSVVKKDLWLVRGALIEADVAGLNVLKKDPTISFIMEDTRKTWLSDPKKLVRRASRADLADGVPWGLKAIKIPELRTAYGQAFLGQKTRVGILDTGIQSKHKEFSSLMSKVEFRDFINKMISPYDDHGHGTHVAGTIAGKDVGIAPKTSLVIGKIFDANGTATDSTILEGMQWMFDPDGNPATTDFPQVVNNSWGVGLGAGFQDIRKQDHFRRALFVWIAGGIVPVFAAGNSGEAPNGVPAGLPESIAVGSFGIDGKVSDFSSRGPNLWTDGTSNFRIFKPDCSAPGSEIMSAAPDNTYVTMSGTSMAAPHVTGSLALLLQIRPQMHPFDVLQMLMDTSVKKGDPGFGIGMLDTMNLVKTAVSAGKRTQLIKQ